MTNKHTFSWKCPLCKCKNIWEWHRDEVPVVGDEIRMECDGCGKHSKMKCKLVGKES